MKPRDPEAARDPVCHIAVNQFKSGSFNQLRRVNAQAAQLRTRSGLRIRAASGSNKADYHETNQQQALLDETALIPPIRYGQSLGSGRRKCKVLMIGLLLSRIPLKCQKIQTRKQNMHQNSDYLGEIIALNWFSHLQPGYPLIPVGRRPAISTIDDIGITLTWRDLNVYVPNKKIRVWDHNSGGKNKPEVRKLPPFKRVVNNITGSVKPGSLLAVMGSSGAGKSTFLQAIANRYANKVIVDGQVLVNGQTMTKKMADFSGFVYQDDVFIPTLTAREHLTIMASLKLDRRTSEYQKKIRVEELLQELGLRGCQESRIGELFTASLKLDRRTSEYQKKIRVEELLQELGLRGCQESRIGEFSKSGALSGGERKRLAFAVEILSDPPVLFCDELTTGLDSFNALLLIGMLKDMAAKGKTVICTIHQPSSEVFEVFDQIMLLAEGRTAFLGSSFECMHLGHKCPSTFNPADYYIHTLSVVPGQELKSRDILKRICDSFAVSSYAGEINSIVQYFGNVNLCSSDSGLLAVCIGFIYMGLTLNQKGIQDTEGCIFVFLTESSFLSTYAVIQVFPAELLVFTREYRNAVYRLDAYYLSKAVSLIPGFVVEPLLFTTIAYFMAGMRSGFYSFFMTALNIIIVANISCAAGCFFSATFETVNMIVIVLTPFMFSQVVTGGFFLNLRSIPWFLHWVQYLSWFRYSNEAMSIIQWEGIEKIECEFSEVDVPCMRNGTQVLAKYGFEASMFSQDFLLLFLLFIAFHVLGFVMLWRRSAVKSIPWFLHWVQYLSWFRYSNEAMSIIQWEGIEKIECEFSEVDVPCMRNGTQVLAKYGFEASMFSQDFLLLFLLFIAFHVLGFVMLWRRSAVKEQQKTRYNTEVLVYQFRVLEQPISSRRLER
ncbi:unnamed protein product, partial [Notodromas monacha]